MKENEKTDQKMYYRMLGGPGLQVSVLSFGFWATYGVKEGLTNEEGIIKAKECMQIAREKGINVFDFADTYGNPSGAAEEIMGEAMSYLQKENQENWRRSEIIVSTKIFWGGTGVNESGLSRKHINEGLDASLRRLQVDYVDLLFCHRPDPFTPTDTIVRGMTDIVRSGRATAWGTSEWSAQQITEAYWIAVMQGLEPPQFEQPHYNMLKRDRVETEYHPLYQEPYQIGTTVWSPLASGILTGKYNNGIPKGSRLTQKGYEFLINSLELHKNRGNIEKIKKLADYASSNLGCSLTELALAWCIKNKNVSTVILGITNPDQLKENLNCLPVAEKLTSKQMEEIDEILDNKPEPYTGFGGQGMRQIVTI